MAEKMIPIKQHQEQFAKNCKEINAKSLQRAYKFLENDSNEAVIYVIEALVGLMRNQKRADN